MPSFKGAFRVTEERAEWVSREPGQPDRHDTESVEIEN
jgi:hypothetical protein